eukprot:2048311-Pyramimonas_sp.AAC.1
MPESSALQAVALFSEPVSEPASELESELRLERHSRSRARRLDRSCNRMASQSWNAPFRCKYLPALVAGVGAGGAL